LVEEELLGCKAWAERNGVALDWLSPELVLRVTLIQPASSEKFYLAGEFGGYKALPPAWEFYDAEWKECGLKHLYPAAAGPPGKGSIFHTKPVICAPFNRLAYKEHGGPHEDWGGASQWLNAGKNYIQAHTIGDMLAAVVRDLAYGSGRMQ